LRRRTFSQYVTRLTHYYLVGGRPRPDERMGECPVGPFAAPAVPPALLTATGIARGLVVIDDDDQDAAAGPSASTAAASVAAAAEHPHASPPPGDMEARTAPKAKPLLHTHILAGMTEPAAGSAEALEEDMLCCSAWGRQIQVRATHLPPPSR